MVKSTVEISQIFVAFSDYMNFKELWPLCVDSKRRGKRCTARGHDSRISKTECARAAHSSSYTLQNSILILLAKTAIVAIDAWVIFCDM